MGYSPTGRDAVFKHQIVRVRISLSQFIRVCRNRQTNCAKNAGIVISCEFKSHYSDLHRSVGMADETDLKSVGLYNRVGSSPMSGTHMGICRNRKTSRA